MPKPTFVGAGAAGDGTPGINGLAWPSGVAVGDVGLLVLETSGSATGTPSITGWTLVPGFPAIDLANSLGSKLFVFWRRTNTATPATVSTGDAGLTNHGVARIFAFRGCVATGDPWDVAVASFKEPASSTAIVPSVTTTVPNTLIFGVAATPADNLANSFFGTPTNSNLSNIVDHGESPTTKSDGGSFVAFSADWLTTGATGTTTLSQTSSTTNTYAVLALKGEATGFDPLNVTAASFAVNTSTARLIKQLVLLVSSVGFALGLNPIDLFKLRTLVAAVRAYTVTGITLFLRRNILLSGSRAVFTVVGLPQQLSRRYALQVLQGTLASAYSAATFIWIRLLKTLQRSFSLAGSPVQLLKTFLQQFILTTQSRAFLAQGRQLSIRRILILSVYRSLFRLRGSFPGFSYKPINKPLFIGRPPNLKTPLLGMRVGQGRRLF